MPVRVVNKVEKNRIGAFSGKKDDVMAKTIYAVYHGRNIEMLRAYFDNDFSAASATAQKVDQVDFFK